eukprot:m.89966 g.89966  ORF g.89966 m.89966 type:complete len:57 (-) comp13248_c0_seq3:73-243(-)
MFIPMHKHILRRMLNNNNINQEQVIAKNATITRNKKQATTNTSYNRNIEFMHKLSY